MMTIEVDTPRLILRTVEPRDAEAMLALHSDPADEELKVFKSTYDSIPKWQEKITEWQRETVEGKNGFLSVVVKTPSGEEERVIGLSGFNIINRSETDGDGIDWVDVGILIFPHTRRKGYSREALGHIIQYGFQVLKTRRVKLDTQKRNVDFTGFMRRMGCEPFSTEVIDEEMGEEVRYEFDARQWEESIRPIWFV